MEVLWKVVAMIFNLRLKVAITLHDVLCGFRHSQGTGTASLEAEVKYHCHHLPQHLHDPYTPKLATPLWDQEYHLAGVFLQYPAVPERRLDQFHQLPPVVGVRCICIPGLCQP